MKNHRGCRRGAAMRRWMVRKQVCRRWPCGRNVLARATVRAERGMATAFVAVAMAVAVTISAVLVQMSIGIAQKERLQNGADLAALGAATKYVAGFSLADSCAVASFIVAELPDRPQLECAAEGDNIRVNVEAKGMFAWLAPTVRVHAVAGPLSEPM